MLKVFVVSDGTGDTAERMLRSALVQFEGASVDIVRRGGVRTPDDVKAVVSEAAGQKSILLHTLVSDELRRLMLAESLGRAVDALDVMGPLLERLATHLQLTPQEKPGLFQQLTEARAGRSRPWPSPSGTTTARTPRSCTGPRWSWWACRGP